MFIHVCRCEQTKMQQNAYIAVRSGNRLLAGEVIKTCQGKETVHGFHKLHEQVSKLRKEYVILTFNCKEKAFMRSEI